jgi:L-alanine-DL-glutamate epimerase-like enolase superfamily enzyme
MRITRVEAIPVRVERVAPFRSALGTHRASESGVVRVMTDEGIEGLGEISMIWNGDGAAYCPMVAQRLGPAVLGTSPFDISRALAAMDDAVQFSRAANPAKAAVEMALYDIAGKALGVPVYTLLGGRMRDATVLSMSVSIGPLPDMALQARDYVARGFRAVKVKVGADREHDVAAVAAVREAVGSGVTVRVDANMGWQSIKDALDAIDLLRPYAIHSVEQPLPADRIEELAELRARSPMPIMVDESVWGVDDAYRVLQARAADIINVYVSEAGGLRNAMRIFALAEIAGVPCTIGSMPELGIGTAACAHLAAAVTHLCDPSDVCGALYHAESLVHESLDIRDGRLILASGPGLGVTLDEERLGAVRIDGAKEVS